MAVHLTPEELADAEGVKRIDVIATCVRLGVPIYQGRIDRTLFQAAVAGSSGDFDEVLQDHTPNWRLH
ncbi:hypothetical protein ACVU7I_02385 [Patulibacter sp. S7RM1-6]